MNAHDGQMIGTAITIGTLVLIALFGAATVIRADKAGGKEREALTRFDRGFTGMVVLAVWFGIFCAVCWAIGQLPNLFK